MGFGVDGIVAASMQMSQANIASAYDMAMMKKAMDGMESEAAAMIEMMNSVPAPSQYNFDVYG